MKYSVGLGITSACNYQCPHCYSRTKCAPEYLTKETVRKLCERLDIETLNLGTGESCLHPDFLEIISIIDYNVPRMALTSNGLSIMQLPSRILKQFHDIDVSLDFPFRQGHDLWRADGAYENVIKAIEKCKENGVEVSIVCCMMNTNYMHMDNMVSFAKKLGTNLRINIYKPVHTDKFTLSYDEFWEGISLLFKNSTILSCSEPIVNALLNISPEGQGSPCGKKSFRVTPSGKVVPCVYCTLGHFGIEEVISGGESIFDDLIDRHEFREAPGPCENCKLLEICRGGCVGRRQHNDISKPDDYCFMLNGKKPSIKFRVGKSRGLVHSDYLCTIIVEGN